MDIEELNHLSTIWGRRKKWITSQKIHGFINQRKDAEKSLGEVENTYVHLNDNTVAGIRLKEISLAFIGASTTQNPLLGPHDSKDTFRRIFILLINQNNTLNLFKTMTLFNQFMQDKSDLEEILREGMYILKMSLL